MALRVISCARNYQVGFQVKADVKWQAAPAASVDANAIKGRSRKHQASDPAPIVLSEPQRAVWPSRDAVRSATVRGDREFGDQTGGRDPADFVANDAARTWLANASGFGKPQGTVWPRRDTPRLSVGIGKSEFDYVAIGGNSIDFPTNRFSEPQRAVWSSRNTPGATVLPGDREFGNCARGRNPPDFATSKCEPQRTVWSSRDLSILGRGDREFGDNAGRRDPPDFASSPFGEP